MEYNFENIYNYVKQGRNKTERPVNYKPKNTKFVIIDENTIGLKYYDTFILKWIKTKDYGTIVQFNSDGFRTQTTKDRMNYFQNHIWIKQHKKKWYFMWQEKEMPFVDFMCITETPPYLMKSISTP